MELQVKLQIINEMFYSEANKYQRRFGLTYLDISN